MESQDDIETRLAAIESEIQAIKERNKKVELDKAWETSRFRIVSVVVLTYILMCLTFWVIEVAHPFINAIIPTLGYYLSTQSLPLLKDYWSKNR